MKRQPQLWTPIELIRVTAEFLADKGVESARLDAELLLAHVLQCDRLHLYLDHDRPIVPDELARYRELVRRRGQREPLQLLLGSATILDHEFLVRPGVFIPRPETEVLIEVARERVGAEPGPLRIVEAGVGTGCVGLSLLHGWPEATLIGYDIDAAALELTRANAERLGVLDRLELREADAFAGPALPACELLVSNPPYVATGERAQLEPEVAEHEPPAALYSGADGLDAIRALVRRGPEAVVPGGFLVFEHGAGQGEAVRDLLEDAGWAEVEIRADLAGRPRVAAARR